MSMQFSQIPQTISKLEDINNVDVTPDDNEALIYDDTNNKWIQSPIAPVGSMMPWNKSVLASTTLPDGWVEMNGQTIALKSAFAGGAWDNGNNTMTIPNVNGNNQFVRGNSTSGGTGGRESFSFTHSTNTTGANAGNAVDYIDSQLGSGSVSILPPYFDAVWIVRIE